MKHKQEGLPVQCTFQTMGSRHGKEAAMEAGFELKLWDGGLVQERPSYKLGWLSLDPGGARSRGGADHLKRLFCFVDKVSVAQTDLELAVSLNLVLNLILLPPLSKCWDHGFELLCWLRAGEDRVRGTPKLALNIQSPLLETVHQTTAEN